MTKCRAVRRLEFFVLVIAPLIYLMRISLSGYRQPRFGYLGQNDRLRYRILASPATDLPSSSVATYQM
jgi:hypothetical protein